MNANLKKKLTELQKDIDEYATYLERSTYHPYSKVEEFGRRLNRIIEEDENENIWLD